MFYTAEDTNTSHDAALLIPYAFHTLEAGGAALRGTRHPGELQDALWPSNLWERETHSQALELQMDVSPETQRRLGRLYIVADGVTHCADGLIAARLAAQTIGRTYYRDDGPPDWKQRLSEAFNAAHQQLLKWQKLYYCAHSRNHRDGLPRHVKPGEVIWHNGQPLCPLCKEPLRGLLSTAVALVIGNVRGGRRVIVGGVGDSRIFRLPPDGPARSLYTPREKEFLGWPRLALQPEVQDIQVRPEELILLGSDGFFSNLNGRYYSEWALPLRGRLRADNLNAEAASLVRELANWGRERDNPVWHDDLALIAVHTGRVNTLALEDEPHPGQRTVPTAPATAWSQQIMPQPRPLTQERLRVTRDEVLTLWDMREDTRDHPTTGHTPPVPTMADTSAAGRVQISFSQESRGAEGVAVALTLIVLVVFLGATVFFVAGQDRSRTAAGQATRTALTEAMAATSLRFERSTQLSFTPTPVPSALLPTSTPRPTIIASGLPPPIAAQDQPTSTPAPTAMATMPPAVATMPPAVATAPTAVILPAVPLADGPRVRLDVLPQTFIVALMEQLGYATVEEAQQEAAMADSAPNDAAQNLSAQPGFLPPRPYQYVFTGLLEPFTPNSAARELTLHPTYDSALSLRLAAPASPDALADLSNWAATKQPVWLLATSDTLDDTIVDCRNNLLESTTQPCRLTQVLGQSQNLVLQSAAMMGIEGETLRPLWLAEAVAQGTAAPLWTFADLGPQGIVLGLSSQDRDRLGGRSGDYGLLQGQLVAVDDVWRFQSSRSYLYVLPSGSDPGTLYQRVQLTETEAIE